MNLRTFVITSVLPQGELERLDLRVVDALDTESATRGDLHAEGARKRLAARGVTDLSEWEVVGYRCRDLSGPCPVEGKWEYYHEDLELLARKDRHAAARKAFFAAQAEPLRHRPFAAIEHEQCLVCHVVFTASGCRCVPGFI